jgi:hypothetical protein
MQYRLIKTLSTSLVVQEESGTEIDITKVLKLDPKNTFRFHIGELANGQTQLGILRFDQDMTRPAKDAVIELSPITIESTYLLDPESKFMELFLQRVEEIRAASSGVILP